MDKLRAPKSRLLRLGGGRVVHMREWPGEGRPIVLLPGMLDSAHGWDDLVLAGDRPCLAVDLAGFGRSSPPVRPRLSAYAEDIVELLGAVGAQSFTLVGHSLGGGVATAVAEMMPHEVASLVLCAPVGFGRIALAELAALPLVRELASGIAPYVLGNPFLLNRIYADFVTSRAILSEDLRRRLIADARRVSPGFSAAVEAVAAAGRARDAFHRRSVRYDGPVTAVWGEQDTVVPPSHRRGLMSALPQAHVQLWVGMGHHPQRERPWKLAELVAAVNEDRTPDTTDAREVEPPHSARLRAPAWTGPAAGGAIAAA